MWEYPMEYVFYGIATIAIWTIINVFIETTTLNDPEEKKKVTHSKSVSDFRENDLRRRRDEALTVSTSEDGEPSAEGGQETRGATYELAGDGDETTQAGNETVQTGSEPPKAGGETVQTEGEPPKAGGETTQAGGEPTQAEGEPAQERVEDGPPPPPPLGAFPAALSAVKEERSAERGNEEELIVKEERATIGAAPRTGRGGISSDDIDQKDDKRASPADACPEGSGVGGGAVKEEKSVSKVGGGIGVRKISGEKSNSRAPPETPKDEKDFDVTGIYQAIGRKRGHRDWTDDSGVSYGTNGGDPSSEDKVSYRNSYHTEDTTQEYLIKKYFGGELKSQRKKSIILNDNARSEYSEEERNLLKNHCGQNDLEFWDLKQERHGWVVETNVEESDKPPTRNQYGEPIPEFDGHTTSFETVNRMCKKEQIVDLVAEGFTEEHLDEVQPPIQVSEWITIRAECRSTYELRVKLLNQEKETISDYQHDHSFSSIKETKWKKVSHIFKEYGPGARYVLFSHGAVKWYGKRGCRMSGATVRVLNPS